MWRAGCVDEAHVRFGRRTEETDRSKDRHRASVRPHYHPRVHSQTGEPPLARLAAADPPPRPPTPAELAEAFLWSEHRTVTKTATVHLHGNVYQVDPALVARRVELVFDPFDLTRVEVRYQGRSMGDGVPHRIDRHTHPHAAAPTPPPPAGTGIDYLALVEARHAADLARRIDYAALPDGDNPTSTDIDPGADIDPEADEDARHGRTEATE